MRTLIQENAEQMDQARSLPDYERVVPDARVTCAHPACDNVPNHISERDRRRHRYCHLHMLDDPSRARQRTIADDATDDDLPQRASSVTAIPPQRIQVPILTCLLEGCDNPRHITKDGHIGPACSYEHYKKWVQSRASRTEAPSPEAARANNTSLRPQTPNACAPSSFQPRVCHFCAGDHLVLSCSAITPKRKELMEQHLGYRHTLTWWCQPANQSKAKSFKLADHTSATPPAMRTQRQPQNLFMHGTVEMLCRSRGIFFDLGSVYTTVNGRH